MASQLNFSFMDQDLSVDMRGAKSGSVIQFGSGFENVQLATHVIPVKKFLSQSARDKVPLLEFVACPGDFPPLPKKETTASMVTPPAIPAKTAVPAPLPVPQKLKSVVVSEITPSELHFRNFEIGSSLTMLPTTNFSAKSRRGNRNCGIRKRIEGENRQAEKLAQCEGFIDVEKKLIMEPMRTGNIDMTKRESLPKGAPSHRRKLVIDNFNEGKEFTPICIDTTREDVETAKIVAAFEQIPRTVFTESKSKNLFFHKNGDDLLDNKVISALDLNTCTMDNETHKAEYEEIMASIHVINTRSSSHEERAEGVQVVEDEEGMSPQEANQRLLQQVMLGDEKIAQMEKMLKELMSDQPHLQSQPVSSPSMHIDLEGQENLNEKRKMDDCNISQQTHQEESIKNLVEKYVREAVVQAQRSSPISKGRPYPHEYDKIPYPKGFMTPSFRIFDGTGNPKQHVAHFRASCCNIGENDALLFRQFVSSLSGVAFDWYADLEDESVKSFT